MRQLGDFFEFTQLVNRFYPSLVLAGLGLSVLFSVSGTLRGVWIILQLKPAEAMRAKPPARARRTVLERWRSLWKRLGFRWHLVIRSLQRHRIRVLTGVLCAMVGTMLILFALTSFDAMDRMTAFTFEKIQVSDLDLYFQGALEYGALLEAKTLPGVDHAEPLMRWFCTLRSGRYERDTSLTGILPSARLTVPRDEDAKPVSVPEWGVLLNRQLAEALHVRVGDVIEATPKEGRREVVAIPVVGIVEGYTGLAAYGDFHYVNSIAGEAESLNAVQTSVDPSQLPHLYQELKGLPMLQGYGNTNDQKRQFEEITDKQRMAMRVMIVFSGLLFSGSIFTASLVSLTERNREIATFRVLGYRPNEIAAIFLRESFLVNSAGILIGLLPGYYLTEFAIASLSTEKQSLPFAIQPATWVWTIGLGLAFTALANFPVLRAIKKMDWLDALNVKE